MGQCGLSAASSVKWGALTSQGAVMDSTEATNRHRGASHRLPSGLALNFLCDSGMEMQTDRQTEITALDAADGITKHCQHAAALSPGPRMLARLVQGCPWAQGFFKLPRVSRDPAGWLSKLNGVGAV